MRNPIAAWKARRLKKYGRAVTFPSSTIFFGPVGMIIGACVGGIIGAIVGLTVGVIIGLILEEW